MARENEQAVLDSARVHHARLRDALERGRNPGRSRALAPRLIASLVVAALACSGCVGYAYISTHFDSSGSTSGEVPTDRATAEHSPVGTTEAVPEAEQEAEQ
ncbi:hypothetical protein [Actinomyces sp.]|uniref:hypothetical protein n=1 Tax=Actinomyces sp. TaxID=29317 RepID=UPI0026DB7CED|nr:hypothetical protein [Actinomyces sp.]MDO4901814.1 hypothetical protein [Actinomyces sp.]